jgi:hypothetical protein
MRGPGKLIGFANDITRYRSVLVFRMLVDRGQIRFVVGRAVLASNGYRLSTTVVPFSGWPVTRPESRAGETKSNEVISRPSRLAEAISPGKLGQDLQPS